MGHINIQKNTIIHGDSLTILRQMEPESVDAIITDPPYGINYHTKGTGASIQNDKSPFIWFLYDAFRVLKSGASGQGTLICFTRWDVEQTFIDAMKIAGFQVKSEVIWDKVLHGMILMSMSASRLMAFSMLRSKTSIPGGRAPLTLLSHLRLAAPPKHCSMKSVLHVRRSKRPMMMFWLKVPRRSTSQLP